MDIDVTRLSEEAKATCMKENRCFHCQKKGHRARDCFKKKREQGQNPPSQVNTTSTTKEELPDIKSFDMQQLADTITQYAEQFSDDSKLDLVEKLLPKDFGKGLN